MKPNRSPGMALLWSLTIPGFGQLYNQDYLVGLLLVVLEFLINVKANLNLVILYSFQGNFPAAHSIANNEWLLFYPCVYAFSLWQAYNKAVEINLKQQAVEGQGNSAFSTRFNGVFVGAAMGGTLGVIYCFNIGPVLGGIAGMVAGAFIGEAVEKLIIRKQHITKNSP